MKKARWQDLVKEKPVITLDEGDVIKGTVKEVGTGYLKIKWEDFEGLTQYDMTDFNRIQNQEEEIIYVRD